MGSIPLLRTFLKRGRTSPTKRDTSEPQTEAVLVALIAQAECSLCDLSRTAAGLNEHDLFALSEDEEGQEILRVARYDTGVSEALDYLDKRNLLFALAELATS